MTSTVSEASCGSNVCLAAKSAASTYVRSWPVSDRQHATLIGRSVLAKQTFEVTPISQRVGRLGIISPDDLISAQPSVRNASTSCALGFALAGVSKSWPLVLA